MFMGIMQLGWDSRGAVNTFLDQLAEWDRRIQEYDHTRELATLVVVEVPSTCHIPTLVGDMAGKRGASQGSPLRVAPGVPSGSGWGPRALYKAIMRSTYIRVGRGVVHLEHRIIEFVCTILGPR